MPEGTYYYRKKIAEIVDPEDAGYRIAIVKDGKAVLADAVYGHEYQFKEIEAPKSYQLSDAISTYKIESPEGKEIVVYIFENKRIEVPNTGIGD